MKKKIVAKCLETLDSKINQAIQMMLSAQESAFSETKSSAGDKYETGREMAMQEYEKANQQKSQAVEMKSNFQKINFEQVHSVIKLGSFIKTNKGNFLLAVSLGSLSVEGENFYIISPNSPLGKEFIGKQKGDKIVFNANEYLISEVI